MVVSGGVAHGDVADQIERRTDGPFTKGGRGLANLLTCWMEVPYRISKTVNRRDPVATFATGAAKGLGWGLARFGAGLYEIVTFPIPIPRRYNPVLPAPGYWRWQRFETIEQTYDNTLR